MWLERDFSTNGPLKTSNLKVAGITSFQSRYILYLQCLLFMFLHPQILFHLNFTCAKAITLILRRHEWGFEIRTKRNKRKEKVLVWLNKVSGDWKLDNWTVGTLPSLFVCIEDWSFQMETIIRILKQMKLQSLHWACIFYHFWHFDSPL